MKHNRLKKRSINIPPNNSRNIFRSEPINMDCYKTKKKKKKKKNICIRSEIIGRNKKLKNQNYKMIIL